MAISKIGTKGGGLRLSNKKGGTQWRVKTRKKGGVARVNKKQERELIFLAVYFSWEFIIFVFAGYNKVYFK